MGRKLSLFNKYIPRIYTKSFKLIREIPISLSDRISNLLVTITFGALVYPEPPSSKSTLITWPLLTRTFALAPPPSPFKGSNLRTGGVKYWYAVGCVIGS